MDPITLAAAKRNTKQQIQDLISSGQDIPTLEAAIASLESAKESLDSAKLELNEAKQVLSASGLPQVNEDDNNKVLTVNEGKWQASIPTTELPQVSSVDEGKILQVDSSGNWVANSILRAEDNAF